MCMDAPILLLCCTFHLPIKEYYQNKFPYYYNVVILKKILLILLLLL